MGSNHGDASDATRDIRALRSLAEAFLRTSERCADQTAVQTLDADDALTWGELRQRAIALAGGLEKLGVCPGDPVAIMLSNRPEFSVADIAAMLLGAVPFSVYPTLPPEQIEYVLRDAGARVAIIERAFLEPFEKARKNLPQLGHVILIDPDAEASEAEPDTLRLDAVEGSNPGFDVQASVSRIGPDDLLTLIYTSGTTGAPKGVQLVHRNMLASGVAFDALVHMPPAARVISWLPAAHIAERAANHYMPILFGFNITCCPDPRQIISVLPRVKPNWFFAVPRIWEKIKAGLEARLAALPDAQREPAQAAIAAAIRKVKLEQAGEPVPEALAEQVARADEQLLSKLRALLGLDEAQVVAAGAAPTSPEVLEFFHALGIEVGELWGMSETCGVGASNPPGAVRIGTVGIPLEGIEIRLAADGEVMIRGDCVMQGYRNQPQKTAEALSPDGWLATGDLGAFDDHGYLRIIDRKKEIIINAAGKNMSPANIESAIKVASPLIGQVCVIGDARPYNTALIVLDADYAPTWAEQQGLAARVLADLATQPEMIREVQEGVDRANQVLARPEQIKKFAILSGDWLPGGDELTPTMKLKRRPIAEKYRAEIEALYAG